MLVTFCKLLTLDILLQVLIASAVISKQYIFELADLIPNPLQ